MDGADAGHHAAGGLRDEPRTGLERLPRALPRSSTCRRRTSSTPTSTATSATRRPAPIPVRATGDGTVPLPGWTSANGWSGTRRRSTSCRRCSTPRAGYIVTANNAGERPAARCSPRTGTSATAPIGIERLLGERIAVGREAHRRRPRRDPARHRQTRTPPRSSRDRGARARRRRRPRRRTCSTAGTAAPTSTAPRRRTSPCSGAHLLDDMFGIAPRADAPRGRRPLVRRRRHSARRARRTLVDERGRPGSPAATP